MDGSDTLSLYGYIPTQRVCFIFVSLFGLSTLIHIGEAVYFRIWWLFPTAVVAGFGEVVGWSARLWSSKSLQANARTPYIMQTTATVLAPTPLVAANFIILGILIRQLGIQYSRLSPRRYTIVFCSADLIALLVQSSGGAIASGNGNNSEKLGGNIVLGGIISQAVAIAIYATLAFEFLFRFYKDRPVRRTTGSDGGRGIPGRRTELMIFGLSFSTLCLFIRAIYRTVELSDGWNGKVVRTQVYFNFLDGAMICIAMFTLNVFHPGFLLSHVETRKREAEDRRGFGSEADIPLVSTGNLSTLRGDGSKQCE